MKRRQLRTRFSCLYGFLSSRSYTRSAVKLMVFFGKEKVSVFESRRCLQYKNDSIESLVLLCVDEIMQIVKHSFSRGRTFAVHARRSYSAVRD